jgi:hypothetical protein
MTDLTILFYTANVISDYFMDNIVNQLLKATAGIPLISISQKPMSLGKNICVGDIGRSSYNIYKQVLIGAKVADTKYVATAEDDVLYPKERFDYRPEEGVFAYDINKWSIYAWTQPPTFSYRDRRTMTSLICSRDALIETLEERFAKYPDANNYPAPIWGEPGRFERALGVTPVKSTRYRAAVPSIVFSHMESLAFQSYLGRKKAHGNVQTDKVEPWGTAEEVLKLYKTKI